LLSSSEEREISEYIAMLAPVKTNIGAIVMNCNPFTLGHRYLIEYAAERCAGLYIFVVEEDKSFFPFADRLELVKKGTADLPNVTILPSGKFIISQRTFAQYSEKEELQDSVIDASFDVALFGQKIAPALNINVRFVGEEPLDNVTRQYNADLRRTLPKYDVDVLIIPRKELDGEVISASRVRKLLEIQDFDGAAKLVPETTLIYLKEKFHYESIGCAAELVDRQDNMDEIESGCKWIHKSKRKIWVERFAEFFGKHTDSDR
jgi:[citrate (pro-3S)-lyase] ligase